MSQDCSVQWLNNSRGSCRESCQRNEIRNHLARTFFPSQSSNWRSKVERWMETFSNGNSPIFIHFETPETITELGDHHRTFLQLHLLKATKVHEKWGKNCRWRGGLEARSREWKDGVSGVAGRCLKRAEPSPRKLV